MGEYVKHPGTGDVIKIGTMDTCFFSREELLDLQLNGYHGFYRGNFDLAASRKDTLERMLKDPATLYKVPKDCTFDSKKHILWIENVGVEHDTVILHHKGNRASVYVYVGLPCRQKDNAALHAVLVGERYDSQGRGRSIFACDCCGKLFSLTKKEAEKLKARSPQWAAWIHANPADGEEVRSCP